MERWRRYWPLFRWVIILVLAVWGVGGENIGPLVGSLIIWRST